MNELLLDKIIESLYQGTKDNVVEWRLRKSIFNSDTCFTMHSFSQDKETEFKIEINLDSNLNIKPNNRLYIYNKDITDGLTIINSSLLTDLELIVYEKFVKKLLKPIPDQEKTFNNILNNIHNKQYNREKWLKDLLDTEKQTENKTSKKWWRF